jgi:hypothetical protein
MSDFVTKPRSDAEIDNIAAQARIAFGVHPETLAPDLERVLRVEIPKRYPNFELLVPPDAELPDADAKTIGSRMFLRATVMAGIVQGVGRARFTGAHEIGHLLMHPGDVRHRMTLVAARPEFIEPSRSGERQADRFAQAFLMPKEIVRLFQTAEALAEKCKVSLHAARIAFDEHVTRQQPRALSTAHVDEVLRELSTAAGRREPRSIGYSSKGARGDIDRLWRELPEAPNLDAREYRLADNKWLIARREFKQMTQCGWTIAGDRVLPYFQNPLE